MAAATDATGLPELTFTRVFDAPRELVFKVWTDPYHVAQWWGPHGFAIPVCNVDARQGGRFDVHMQGEDGTILPSVGEFFEVVPPKRIIFSSNLEDGHGNRLIEVVNTITLEEEGSKTMMRLHVKVTRAVPEVADRVGGMEAGWTESLQRFEAEIVRAVESN
jgi:uncharacterized protein YndB with AHSA1/START domain